MMTFLSDEEAVANVRIAWINAYKEWLTKADDQFRMMRVAHPKLCIWDHPMVRKNEIIETPQFICKGRQ